MGNPGMQAWKLEATLDMFLSHPQSQSTQHLVTPVPTPSSCPTVSFHPLSCHASGSSHPSHHHVTSCLDTAMASSLVFLLFSFLHSHPAPTLWPEQPLQHIVQPCQPLQLHLALFSSPLPASPLQFLESIMSLLTTGLLHKPVSLVGISPPLLGLASFSSTLDLSWSFLFSGGSLPNYPRRATTMSLSYRVAHVSSKPPPLVHGDWVNV